MEFFLKTDFCNIKIEYEDNYVLFLNLSSNNIDDNSNLKGPQNKFEKEIAFKFSNYLSGMSTELKIPFKLSSTKFCLDVYKEVCNIPYGKTITYKNLALKINNPKATRAVGNALNKNPLPLLIPCHRVIGSNGIGGFKYGNDLKIKLLKLEGSHLPK